MRFIVEAGDAAPDAPVGGKARALADLLRAGFEIPRWFVVTPDAFWASLSTRDRERFPSASDHELTDIVQRVQPVVDVTNRIEAAIRALAPDGRRLAVRSSASDEDGAHHSFAGQLESLLNVAHRDVAAAIAAVWRSGFSDRILAYRRQHSLPLPPPVPAVLVQRMVDARVSGVAFSADPISGRRTVAVVGAIPGLGTALVSGEGDADSWHVSEPSAGASSHAEEILTRTIGIKTRIHVADHGGRDGVRTATLDDAAAARPALDDREVVQVARLVRQVAQHAGRPQDVEWAFENGDLLLLQARPITTLPSIADPEGEVRLWDNSNIVESYSGVTTPLTFSFAAEIYEHVYRQFCRMMRVPEQTVLDHDETFRNMLGLIQGRMYYNLVNWYRVLALLPGFSVNRRFMEQMMGVTETLPPIVAEAIEREATRGKLRDGLHLASTLAGLLWQHLTIGGRVSGFYERLDVALAPASPPLKDRSADALVAHYRDLRAALLLKWDAPLVNDFFAMIFYGALRKLTTRWCGDAEGTLQNDLVGGDGGLVSAEPAARLMRLAALASAAPAFADLLVNGDRAAIAAALPDQPAFDAEYREYLDKFGERSVNELKLETETLHDDPLPLWRAIGQLERQQRGRDQSSAMSAGHERRASAERRAFEALASHPLRRLAFRWVLRHARARVRDRENLRLERTRLFGRVRRIFVEIGRRFHAAELLADSRDVFYLEVDEVLGLVEGRSTCTSIRSLAALRRAEFAAFERTPAPPSRFETRGIVSLGQTFASSESTAPAGGDERKGQGCCPGVVRGPVRIVRDPRLVDLSERAVLVAEHTDPGWILVLPSALGVLVERGSLLSHAAIVTRELGIPSIVGLPGITGWLKDDDWIEMDGSRGTVRRIPADRSDSA
jgi:phosphohistidine swiveling domain-containing protein